MARLLTWWRLIVGLVGIVVAVGAIAVAYVFVVGVEVKGSSMRPTLQNGDRLVLRGAGDVERFDLVIARWGQYDAKAVKRVIGLPGDIVRIEHTPGTDARVYVQPGGTGPWLLVRNEAWTGQWDAVPTSCCSADGKRSAAASPQRVPEGMLFVMGDNPLESVDSRKNGWAPLQFVTERVWLRGWPLGGVGAVDNPVTTEPADR